MQEGPFHSGKGLWMTPAVAAGLSEKFRNLPPEEAEVYKEMGTMHVIGTTTDWSHLAKEFA